MESDKTVNPMVVNQASQKRVAILIENGVEDSEFQVPFKALQMAGAKVVVLGSRMNEKFKGKEGKVSIQPDGTTTEARAEEFDAVVIPGGMAPDRMRVNPNTVRFVKEAMEQGKIVAAVCHGPQVLINGDLLQGKTATGFIAIRKDIINAGANYVDQPLAVDGNLLTSRRPGDLPIFTTAILKRLDLSIPDTTLPDENDLNAGWWKLAAEWDGSSKSEIVDGINTALAGERYGLEAFERYLEKTSDAEIRSVFSQVCANKRRHIQMLEARLEVLGETASLQAAASGAYATLKTWLQGTNDEQAMLRHALGDLQTGVVDTYNLRNKFTDPATVEIFDEMEVNLAKDERHVGELTRARISAGMKPPEPTTRPAVSA